MYCSLAVMLNNMYSYLAAIKIVRIRKKLEIINYNACV